MYRRFVQIPVAILVAIASAPLALLAARTVFSGGALTIVPTCCAAFWLSISSGDRSRRVGWFVFASVVTFLLPTCPWWSTLMHDGSVAVQGFVFNVRFLYQLVEMIAVCAMFVLPWISSCLLGWFAAKLVRSRLASSNIVDNSRSAKSFTLRGLLIAMVVVAGLTTWLSSQVSQWQLQEQKKQQVFMDFFKRSFTSGKVEFLQEPQMLAKSGHGTHYRITAPIRKNGEEQWAMWTYWCEHPSFLYMFGYAEAPTEDALTTPIPEHLPQYSAVIDGEPMLNTFLKIVEAEVIESPTSTSGAIIEIIAETDQRQECDLDIHSFNAIKTVPKMKIAPESGIVSWEVELNKKYRGSKIDFEVKSRVNRIYRAKKTAGLIALPETATASNH